MDDHGLQTIRRKNTCCVQASGDFEALRMTGQGGLEPQSLAASEPVGEWNSSRSSIISHMRLR